MIDCSLVKQELESAFDFDNEMLEKYDTLISYAVNCVDSLVKNEEDKENIKIIHLCAVKALYNVELVNKDDVSSFKAGDVSYTKDTSSFDKVQRLYNDALAECKAMLINNASCFAFEVM